MNFRGKNRFLSRSSFSLVVVNVMVESEVINFDANVLEIYYGSLIY